MAYEKVTFKSQLKTDNPSFISITKSHIRFSSIFVKIAKIGPDFKVIIHKDNQEHKLKFEFTKNIFEDCLTLTQPKNKTNLQISAVKLYNEINWLRSFANNDGKERRIIPTKLTGLNWEISLRPSFENFISRVDLSKKVLKIKGIYRYKNYSGDIIYIGKGDVRLRFQEPQRKLWDFDLIEYSEIKDENDQLKWESYWIEEFKKRNNGKLPKHNEIKGRKLK